LFGYRPVVRRKPFGPHGQLTVGALSCAIGIDIGQIVGSLVDDP
jgi:hypothetical protein